jgi:DNA repair exonuclease SbcCD ATPase subunit
MSAADAAYDPYRRLNAEAELPAARQTRAEAEATVGEINAHQQTVAVNEAPLRELDESRRAVADMDRDLARHEADLDARRREWQQSHNDLRNRQREAEEARRRADEYDNTFMGMPNPAEDPQAWVSYMASRGPTGVSIDILSHAAAWAARMMSSGQSWQDIIGILQRGKETVERLREEVARGEALLANLQEGVAAYRSALDSCLQENGGVMQADGTETVTSIDDI